MDKNTIVTWVYEHIDFTPICAKYGIFGYERVQQIKSIVLEALLRYDAPKLESIFTKGVLLKFVMVLVRNNAYYYRSTYHLEQGLSTDLAAAGDLIEEDTVAIKTEEEEQITFMMDYLHTYTNEEDYYKKKLFYFYHVHGENISSLSRKMKISRKALTNLLATVKKDLQTAYELTQK